MQQVTSAQDRLISGFNPFPAFLSDSNEARQLVRWHRTAASQCPPPPVFERYDGSETVRVPFAACVDYR